MNGRALFLYFYDPNRRGPYTFALFVADYHNRFGIAYGPAGASPAGGALHYRARSIIEFNLALAGGVPRPSRLLCMTQCTVLSK